MGRSLHCCEPVKTCSNQIRNGNAAGLFLDMMLTVVLGQQDSVLLPQARVGACTPRGHSPTMGYLSSRRQCTSFCFCTWIHVRLNLPSGRLRRAHKPYCRRRSQIYKRGYVFRRGPLVVQMFQQEQVSGYVAIRTNATEPYAPGRSKNAEAYHSSPRHALGGGSAHSSACAQHSGDSSE